MTTTETTHPDQDLLMDLAYGELSGIEASEVQGHVDGCPACAGVLASIGGVRRAMAPLAEIEAPDAGLESLLAYAAQTASRNAQAPDSKPRWWRRIGFAGVTAAASAVCIVGLVGLVGLRTGGSTDALSGSTVVAEGPQLEQFGSDAELRPDDALRREEAKPSRQGGAARSESGAQPPPPPAAVPMAERLAEASPRRKRSAPRPPAFAPAPEAKAKGGVEEEREPLADAAAAPAEAVMAAAPGAPSKPQVEAPRSVAARAPVPAASSGAAGGASGMADADALRSESRSGAPTASVARRAAEEGPASEAPKKASKSASREVATIGGIKTLGRGAGPVGDEEGTSSSGPDPRLVAEVGDLRQRLTGDLTGDQRRVLLARLCQVEASIDPKGADRTCATLVTEFPNARDAIFARDWLKRRSAGAGATDGGR